ncbi:MAG TPA: ABC transporter permease [Gemmatimonadaceae bacterium]|nr:ABC transporter permease [Gemmatimonadaceae bacterium]
MDSFLRDLTYAARTLRKAPGFTLIAVLTLALAIGASTAIFSVVNGVLLKPLPFHEPDQLVRVTTTNTSRGNRNPLSVADFMDYRSGTTRSFAGMAAFDGGSYNLTRAGSEPARLSASRVSANYFNLLRVQPAIGRGFVAGEDDRGAPRVVVLSDELFRGRFAGDPKLIGQTITLNGEQYTVIGVAPRGLAFPDKVDLWLPLSFSEDEASPSNRGAHWLGAFGRLAPGVTVAQADRELSALAKRLEQQFPRSNTNFGAAVIDMREYMVGNVRAALLAMLGAVGFVLLIACANVANLLLVRAAGRETELAVRTALGAGRLRIVRQLVTESVLLALLGAVGGVLIAAWGVDLLKAFGPERIPRLSEVRLDGGVMAFAGGLALFTGLLFGVVPALHASGAQVTQALKEGRGSSGRPASRRARSTLVVLEMALAVVLLVGAGLLLRSFDRLLSVDPGFKPEQVVVFEVQPPDSKYQYFRLRNLVTDLTTRMRTVPGAQSAAVVFGLPMGGGGMMRTSVHEIGTPEDPPGQRKITDVATVTPEYFSTMGIPLVRGRAFADADRLGRPQVAIVNRELVKKYFPDVDPIGKRVEIGWTTDTMPNSPEIRMGGEIVGIVGDTKRLNLGEESVPQLYLPFDQAAIPSLNIIIRSTAEPTAVIAAARTQLRAIDAELPMYNVRTLEEVVSSSVAQPRFYTLLLGAFAGIALVLAAVGIYGVISYAVSLRTREIGIRVALGATREQVIRLILGQGMALTAGGVIVGAACALWATRAIAGMLFGIQPTDPLTFAGVAAVLLGSAALACIVPARRAARVDPVVAMRVE